MTVWPSDNTWGVPSLDPVLQATPQPPVCSWGSRSRYASMTGTWVFYVDDYRFGSVLKRPSIIGHSCCSAAAEPNISIFDDSTAAEALWATFRKRQCSREWQSIGLPVFVDLNVPERHMEVSLLGVPKGWRSFATRGYARRQDDLIREHAVATSYGGSQAILLVFGGGSPIRDLCLNLPGAVWFPSHSDSARGLHIQRSYPATMLKVCGDS